MGHCSGSAPFFAGARATPHQVKALQAGRRLNVSANILLALTPMPEPAGPRVSLGLTSSLALAKAVSRGPGRVASPAPLACGSAGFSRGYFGKRQRAQALVSRAWVIRADGKPGTCPPGQPGGGPVSGPIGRLRCGRAEPGCSPSARLGLMPGGCALPGRGWVPGTGCRIRLSP